MYPRHFVARIAVLLLLGTMTFIGILMLIFPVPIMIGRACLAPFAISKEV